MMDMNGEARRYKLLVLLTVPYPFTVTLVDADLARSRLEADLAR